MAMKSVNAAGGSASSGGGGGGLQLGSLSVDEEADKLELFREKEMSKRVKGGTWTVETDGYFTWTDNANYKDIRAELQGFWRKDQAEDQKWNWQKQVIPELVGGRDGAYVFLRGWISCYVLRE
ncbi:unnamed protein product [Amoebophrya sp. A25]|nr:unnamed protein product [Amoebophrya sp. A25]|eukprot:GSA25T00027745001.1